MAVRPERTAHERDQPPGTPSATVELAAAVPAAATLLPRILCVDDDPAVLKVLTRALETHFEIVTANDPRKALVLLEHGMDFSVVISDMKMPQMDGAEFLARVRRLAPTSTRLALTACLERELSTDEVFGILTKPCPLNLLQASVQAAVDHHALQTLLRSPASARGSLPESPLESRNVPGLRSSQRDSDPTLALPHLAFDPWSTSFAPDPAASNAPRLSVLAGVAEKFFRLGHAQEAERILRPALWDLLQRCESDRRASEREIELAGKLALRLAEDTRSAQWIDYVFRVFTSMSRPLSTELLETLHELVRRIPGVSRGAFLRYLSALRACRHEFGPGEHFLIRRIEGLDPLICP
jgi:CheY-like chemotaxis protein